MRCMGFFSLPLRADGLITPELRSCRNYYSEESEAERTVEAERPIFFVLFWKGIGGPGRVNCTLVYRPVSPKIRKLLIEAPCYSEKPQSLTQGQAVTDLLKEDFFWGNGCCKP